MKHIVFGLLAIIVGLWGIAVNWYQFLDLIWVLAPMVLLVAGVVALSAGVGNFNPHAKPKDSSSIDNELE